MATRTDEARVKSIMGRDYDHKLSLRGPIQAANALTNNLVKLIAKYKPFLSLDNSTLELIERYLAAHFYQAFDKGYTQRSTSQASGGFQGQKGTTGLETTEYGARALILDYTRVLNAMDKGHISDAFTGPLCGWGDDATDDDLVEDE